MKRFGGSGRKKKCCEQRHCYQLHKINIKKNVPLKVSTTVNPTELLLKQGRKVNRVKGDGNCMYRSIAHLLTRSEENHCQIRQMFENLNKEVFNKVLTSVNEPTLDQHITNIGIPSVWGTHIELLHSPRSVGGRVR